MRICFFEKGKWYFIIVCIVDMLKFMEVNVLLRLEIYFKYKCELNYIGNDFLRE